MRKLLSILLLLFAFSGFAQNKLEYANFIQKDTAVKWAAIYNSYINLSTVNPNFNLRNFYVNKLKQGTVKAYTEDITAFAVTAQQMNYEQYKASLKPVNYNPVKMNWRFTYDQKSDVSEMIFNQEKNNCDTCLLKNKFSFFKVKQLLYYINNQLRIQNVLLTPVIYKKTDSMFRENTEYFEAGSFAFNDTKSSNAPIPATAKFIGRSCNNLMLLPSAASDPTDNTILTMHNWNLAEILHHDIRRKRLKAYDTERSIYPNAGNLLDYRKIDEYKMRSYEVAMYDSLGNMIGTKRLMTDVNFDSIYNYTLVQDLYFDFDKEILYSKLIALAPRLQVRTSAGIYLGLTDYWGVIFREEKGKAVKKTK